MKSKKKGFTLIELLVVVAIIALLISILLPSLSRARELAKRAVCASNLRGIGQGCHIYSNDNTEWFPVHYFVPVWPPQATSPTQTHGITYARQMGSGNGPPRISQATTLSTGSNKGHVSRSLFLLIIAGGSTPGQMICPSAGDTEDDMRNRGADASSGTESAAQPGINRFDFRGYPYLSYGYQMPFGRRARPRQSLDVRMPMAADKGPYFTIGTADSSTQTTADEFNQNLSAPTGMGSTVEQIVKASNDKWRAYNSQNHNGEGQNMLFVDGHADFGRKPIAGVNNDNIYTIQEDWTDPIKVLVGISPGQNTSNAGRAPLANTDSVIIP